jgi:sterol desaturase/sphingolipid hydroxylase (fatty acid hydroxylase superfamily)
MNSEFREQLLVLISLPVYMIVIGLELFFSHTHDLKWYDFKETFTSIYLTILNIMLDLGMRIIALYYLILAYNHRFFSFEKNVWYWIGLACAIDFMYYWLHRLDHSSRFFWAVHVTHHSSTHYNISVGFRSSVFEPIYRFLFYIPIALVGFKALDILFMHAVLQTYGTLIHTQSIKKLPRWLEYFLVSPSHHRVHHGSNIEYLDRNRAMTFSIWDRLFGTFQDELDEVPVEYGLTSNPEDRGAVNIVFHEWRAIAQDFLQKNIGLKTRFDYVFKAPGWSHDGSRMTSEQMREAQKKGLL